METLNIVEAIGTPNAILTSFGTKVAELVLSLFKQGAQQVRLDFSGLANATSGFFNALIGGIYREYSQAADNMLEIVGLEKDIFHALIAQAKRLGLDPMYRKATEMAYDEALKTL